MSFTSPMPVIVSLGRKTYIVQNASDMKKKLLLCVILLLTALPLICQAHTTLSKGGKPKVRIVNLTETPHTEIAADILGRFLGESLGGSIPVTGAAALKKGDIVLADCEVPGVGEDGFLIEVKDGKVFISGREKGVVYGVCDFLEKELGMDYWGNFEYDLPRHADLTLPCKSRLENPTFRYRQASHWCLRNGNAAATSDNGVNKIRSADTLYRWWYRLEEPHELFVDNLWVHTCKHLLPVEKYGETHPEYYAWYGGERHPGSASQWCLSNPEVFEIVCATLDSLFNANPGLDMISISQNDGSDTFCRCPECQRIIEEEGSPSGPIMRFINAVAERFPDKQISTLAYLFSVKPPKVTVPRDNVSIMLCDIDCRRQTALTENPSGQEFMECLEGWSRLTQNIFLWDYGINFDNYLSPFPNFGTIKDNMVIFRDHGVKMHFSQINSSLGGDFAELRPYIVSKLMWNASADLDSLENHFCRGYYGAAAPYVLHYIHELEGASIGTDQELFIYDSPVTFKNTTLRPALMKRYNVLFDQAEAAVADDPVRLKRVQRSRLSLQYSALEIARTDPDHDAVTVSKDLDLFESRVKEFGIETLNERTNKPLDYCALYRKRHLNDDRDNLSFRRPVSFIIPPKEKYMTIARTALTDGLYGGAGYVESWVGWEGTDADLVIDLGEEKSVSSVSVDFLRQIGAWVMEPLGMKVLLSSDGENYTLFNEESFPETRDGTIGFKTVTLGGSLSGRFVRIQVEGLKICPEWHYGVGNPCWFFIDEVSVR